MPRESLVYQTDACPRNTRALKLAPIIAFCLVFTAFPACRSAPSAPVPSIEGSPDPSNASTEARPRDLDAAVRFASAELDMVILGHSADESGERLYRLQSIRDEPAWLIATSEAGWDEPRDARPITLRARVTRLGDERRERELVRRVSDRLAFLRERDPR